MFIIDHISGEYCHSQTEGMTQSFEDAVDFIKKHSTNHTGEEWDVWEYTDCGMPYWANWKIAHRISCPEYGYPDCEARFLSIEEYEKSGGKFT